MNENKLLEALNSITGRYWTQRNKLNKRSQRINKHKYSLNDQQYILIQGQADELNLSHKSLNKKA